MYSTLNFNVTNAPKKNIIRILVQEKCLPKKKNIKKKKKIECETK